MNNATDALATGRATCAAQVFCCLLALQLATAMAQQPSNGNSGSGANDTLDVLRQAEEMARQAPPVPAGNTAMSQAQPATIPGQQSTRARLYVFVSFSIPPASLHRLAAQAASIQVPLVIRGMVNESLGATARRAAEVVNAIPGASFEIDPTPFSRFGITRVPSFAIATPSATCVNACVPDQAAEVLTGDVTLDYALERLARGDGPAPTLALDLLARLRSKR